MAILFLEIRGFYLDPEDNDEEREYTFVNHIINVNHIIRVVDSPDTDISIIELSNGDFFATPFPKNVVKYRLNLQMDLIE